MQVSVGNDQTCALLESGNVRCWGIGIYGRLGYGNTNSIGDDETPASVGDVNVGAPVAQIATGENTCARLTNGNVRCWGRADNGLGYMNEETIGDNETPASAGDVNIGASVAQVAVGRYHVCAVLTSGALRCWGAGYVGQLGYGNTKFIGDNETPASAGDVPVLIDVHVPSCNGTATQCTVMSETSCKTTSQCTWNPPCVCERHRPVGHVSPASQTKRLASNTPNANGSSASFAGQTKLLPERHHASRMHPSVGCMAARIFGCGYRQLHADLDRIQLRETTRLQLELSTRANANSFLDGHEQRARPVSAFGVEVRPQSQTGLFLLNPAYT